MPHVTLPHVTHPTSPCRDEVVAGDTGTKRQEVHGASLQTPVLGGREIQSSDQAQP